MPLYELYLLLGQNPNIKCFKLYKEGHFCNTRYSIRQVIEFIMNYKLKVYTAYMADDITIVIEVK